MTPIKDMQFVVTKQDGQTIVRGKMNFDCRYVIDGEAMLHARIDLLEDTKERMRRDVWHTIYGDLVKPMRALQHEALKYAPLDRERYVRDLVDQLRALLDPPNAH